MKRRSIRVRAERLDEVDIQRLAMALYLFSQWQKEQSQNGSENGSSGDHRSTRVLTLPRGQGGRS